MYIDILALFVVHAKSTITTEKRFMLYLKPSNNHAEKWNLMIFPKLNWSITLKVL